MRIRLHIKIALWLLLAGILPLAIMGGYSMIRVKQTVQETAGKALHSLAQEISNEVHRVVRNGVNSIYYLAENLVLTSGATDTGQLEEELRKTQRFHPIIKDLTFLDLHGGIRASALYSFRGTWSATSWFQRAVEGQYVFTGVHSVLYPFDIVMTTAVPVFNAKSKEITSVLVGQLSMEPIWQIFSDLQLGSGARALLLDNRGVIVSSPDTEKLLTPAPPEIINITKKGDSGFAHITRQGHRELMVYVTLRGRTGNFTDNWHIVITQPVISAYAATAGVWRGLMLAAAVSLAVVALVSTILSRHINSRIRPLIKATRSLGKGEFPPQLHNLGHDEIGELGEAFVNTSAELAKSSEAVRKYQENLEELVESRTQALQESNTLLQQQIEERICMEEERKRLEELFRQSQKMEAVGTLAGGIAHDFNNILQIITGQVQLLLISKDASDPEVTALSEIDQAISRAAELVRRLLTFSRKMETAPQRLNLNSVITSSVKLLSRTIPRMITIKTHLDAGLDDVMADYNQIEQILMNLTSNSADAMPEGGTLTITTENRSIDPSLSSFLGITPDNYAVMSIADTGIGMDESIKKRIFEPFFTSKEIGRGTGLGLSTVYGIIQDHGGHILCYSEPGHGTQFFIYLPVATGMIQNEAIPAQKDDTAMLGGLETILVVDDEDIVREIAEDMLSRFGYKVYLADSGEEAVEIYSRLQDDIDLIITDIGMPGMGGEKLIEALLAQNPQVKIIVASGYTHPAGDQNQNPGTGNHTFIQKPYQLKNMLKSIRHFLDH